MSDKILLSICMIVKNEEVYINNCLNSMMPLVNEGIAELIIVDTGSIDKTVEICKRYTDKIYYKKWNNNFSEARNYSISVAKGEYLFIQDADQTIDEKSIDDFINIFKNKEYKNYNTIYVKLRNYLDNKLEKYSNVSFPLIFKNDGEFKYSGAVHNQPLFKNPIMYTNIQINHYGYIMDEQKIHEKFNRTATILREELKKDPDNYYYRFQLARSYNSTGDYKSAMIQVDYYMDYILNKEKIKKDDLKYYRTAAQTYYINNNFNKTIHICNRVIDRFPYFLDCIYLRGLSFEKKRLYEESNKELYNYLNVLDSKLYLENSEVEMFSVSSRDTVIATIEGNKRTVEFNNYIIDLKNNLKVLIENNVIEATKAIDELRKLEKYNNIRDLEFFSITSAVYYMNMNYEKALEEVERGLNIEKNCFDLLYNKGCILDAIGNYEEAIRCYNLSKSICDNSEMMNIINDRLKQLDDL